MAYIQYISKKSQKLSIYYIPLAFRKNSIALKKSNAHQAAPKHGRCASYETNLGKNARKGKLVVTRTVSPRFIIMNSPLCIIFYIFIIPPLPLFVNLYCVKFIIYLQASLYCAKKRRPALIGWSPQFLLFVLVDHMKKLHSRHYVGMHIAISAGLLIFTKEFQERLGLHFRP